MDGLRTRNLSWMSKAVEWIEKEEQAPWISIGQVEHFSTGFRAILKQFFCGLVELKAEPEILKRKYSLLTYLKMALDCVVNVGEVNEKIPLVTETQISNFGCH